MASHGIRLVTVLAGLLLVIAAVVLPSQWYLELPLPVNIGLFPFTGIALFRTAFLLEGVFLLLLVATGWRYQRISESDRLLQYSRSEGPLSHTHIGVIFSIFGLAVLLRSLALSQSFWLDEVATLDYAVSSLFEQLTLYVGPNNHLLNTLLIKLSISLFGESEWAVRLPAVIFGAATIPVLFWVLRPSVGAWPAIAVSLLLAVSYHHIFFSQNARGYSAYLFLSLLATGLFLRALRQDEMRVWMLYIVVMFLDFSALINSIFVFLAHAIVGIIALFLLRRQGANIWPVARRLFLVFLISGLLVFHLYAIEIPQIYVVLSELYANQATGFSLFSVEFLLELVRGVSAGFGAGAVIAALPFMLVAGAGIVSFFKKDLLLALLLLLPGVITAIYLLAKGLAVSPRFFLFGIFFALISAVAGIISTSNWLGRRLRLPESLSHRISIAVVSLMAGLSVASLHNYYTTPKQGFRAAVEYIEQEKTTATKVIVVFTAESGIAYYHEKKRDADNSGGYTYVRDVPTFNAELKQAGNRPIYVITTFHRALGISLPEILGELEEHWRIVKIFPATIGDGRITVWVRK